MKIKCRYPSAGISDLSDYFVHKNVTDSYRLKDFSIDYRPGSARISKDLHQSELNCISPLLPVVAVDGKFLGLAQCSYNGVKFCDTQSSFIWSLSECPIYLGGATLLYLGDENALESKKFISNLRFLNYSSTILAIPVYFHTSLHSVLFYNVETDTILEYSVDMNNNDFRKALSSAINYSAAQGGIITVGDEIFNPYDMTGVNVEYAVWKLAHPEDQGKLSDIINIEEPSEYYSFNVPPFVRKNLIIAKNTGSSKLAIHNLVRDSKVYVYSSANQERDVVCYPECTGSVTLASTMSRVKFKAQDIKSLAGNDLVSSKLEFRSASDVLIQSSHAVDVKASRVGATFIAATRAYSLHISSGDKLSLESDVTGTCIDKYTSAEIVSKPSKVLQISLDSAKRVDLGFESGDYIDLNAKSLDELRLYTFSGVTINVDTCNKLCLGGEVSRLKDTSQIASGVRGIIKHLQHVSSSIPLLNPRGTITLDAGSCLSGTKYSLALNSEGCNISYYKEWDSLLHNILEAFAEDENINLVVDFTSVTLPEITVELKLLGLSFSNGADADIDYYLFILIYWLSLIRFRTNRGTKINLVVRLGESTDKLRNTGDIRKWFKLSLKKSVYLRAHHDKAALKAIVSRVQSLLDMFRNSNVCSLQLPTCLFR